VWRRQPSTAHKSAPAPDKIGRKGEKDEILWAHTCPTVSSRPRGRCVQSLVPIGSVMWIFIRYKHTNIHLYIYYIILYYIILYYIILHYITLHYIILHYITLHYITLHYIILYYIVSYHIILYYIILYYIILYYIILYYIILYYIILYYIILYYIILLAGVPGVAWDDQLRNRIAMLCTI